MAQWSLWKRLLLTDMTALGSLETGSFCLIGGGLGILNERCCRYERYAAAEMPTFHMVAHTSVSVISHTRTRALLLVSLAGVTIGSLPILIIFTCSSQATSTTHVLGVIHCSIDGSVYRSIL